MHTSTEDLQKKSKNRHRQTQADLMALFGEENRRAREIVMLKKQILEMADIPHVAQFLEQSKARLAVLEALTTKQIPE